MIGVYDVFWTSYSCIMPPYYCDCTCPANYGINRAALFFVGFLGLGAVLLTSALRSTGTDERAAANDAEQQRRRIKVLEDQVERAFNAVMAMIVLVLAMALTILLSHRLPLQSDRTEL